ncbi:DUF4252 domain-containing protein [Capnocytophaga canimorsus]|uniref:DUF4252 domain-containing protein n=2 Tax=Capnocytophaga canimorsus TaxID=28188 RepID=F9YSN8_CAPCC|nr:DUF4252 domain-containing protein [Capnocytophaga canimorsus]AEK22711.1 Conserved hypothetical protein [Capnocytophaga canimorsus Cc5]ATA77856.1 DUF4252 domain-containing protein [Capnocytophaga canimorsus]ATA92488.1 DUF4252 domain-containing protein [Capnocytophaga canimorsus]ATA94610.1 DUF4252 domain-containing protein [Capnocytophaga canimorsus]AWL79331.1 DUF4252 domain-containing protein [Capnocytophaga canimorsus]
MKTKFIFLVSALFGYFSTQAQSVFDKFEDNSEVTTVVVSQKMFQMLSKIDSKDPEAKEFMDVANKLTGLKIFTTSNKSVGQKMSDEVKKYLSTASLSELMRVKDKDSNVKFYVKQGRDADHVSELLMFIVDSSDSQTVLLTLTGDIDLNKIGALTGNMNLPEEFKSIKK